MGKPELCCDVTQFDLGTLGSLAEPDVESLHVGYSPSIDPGATLTDVGGVRSNSDNTTALSHAFIDRHKNLSCLRCRGRFQSWNGDPLTSPSIGMPSSWSVEVAQPAPAAEQLEKIRKRATDIDSCVKATVDRSFIDAKEFDMKRHWRKAFIFLTP